MSKAKDDDERVPSGDEIDNQDQHSKTIRDRSVRCSGMFGSSEGVVGLREVCRLTTDAAHGDIVVQMSSLHRNRVCSLG